MPLDPTLRAYCERQGAQFQDAVAHVERTESNGHTEWRITLGLKGPPNIVVTGVATAAGLYVPPEAPSDSSPAEEPAPGSDRGPSEGALVDIPPAQVAVPQAALEDPLGPQPKRARWSS